MDFWGKKGGFFFLGVYWRLTLRIHRDGGQTDGQMDGQTDGQTHGQTDRQTDGRTGRRDRRRTSDDGLGGGENKERKPLCFVCVFGG